MTVDKNKTAIKHEPLQCDCAARMKGWFISSRLSPYSTDSDGSSHETNTKRIKTKKQHMVSEGREKTRERVGDNTKEGGLRLAEASVCVCGGV